MALLKLLSEEEIAEDRATGYLDDLYQVVCVGERMPVIGQRGALVRSTYVVDWEQLVHLLEDYQIFGEDIIEVSAISGDQATLMRTVLSGRAARA